MIPRVPGSRRLSSVRVFSTSERTIHTYPPEHHSDIVQGRGGLVAIPLARSTTFPCTRFKLVKDGISERLTKLLLNVNIESSLGPVHVIISAENTVNDLIKAAIEVYVKEKRRPLLEETDPKFFQLHYSQFSLESKFKGGGESDKFGIEEFLFISEEAASCGHFMRLIGKGTVGIGASVFFDKICGVVALKTFHSS